VDTLNEKSRPMVVELGPESLLALKRLAEVIEMLDPGVKESEPSERQLHLPDLLPNGDAGEGRPASEVVSLPLSHPTETKQPHSPWLNAQEAAAYLRVSLKSLYSQVERGNLKPGRGPRRRLLFKKEMLDRYVQRRGVRA
jgi:excisionase family DNA binding protein